MITSAAQLKEWQKMIETGDLTEVLSCIQNMIDGKGDETLARGTSLAGSVLVEKARNQYADDSDNNIEIDDDAGMSVSDCGIWFDCGTWVQAWVWIAAEETEEEG